MIEELKAAEPEEIGYYSGLVDSMFSIAQLCTVRLFLIIVLSRLRIFGLNHIPSGYPTKPP
jgi:hypothetical protein